jgi:hypothetical protein
LAAVRPSEGKGIDICAEIVEIAKQRNPAFEFAVAFPDKDEFRPLFGPSQKFDYILFNDIGDTVDVLQAFRNLQPLCQRHTRVLVTTYNHLWEPLVTFAEWDWDECAAHRAKLAFHRRHSEFVEASRF